MTNLNTNKLTIKSQSLGILLCLVLLTSTGCADNKKEVKMPDNSIVDVSKLPEDGGDEYNRLIFSKSPYLLQHAKNPVDWYEWGEEAFAKAKKEDKPIFLSIGYSSCHWCHVMEEESFDDEDVAKVLNENFVAIKVDREERPDIDNIYMAVCQAMTGSGGWPLTIMMTHDKKPFFAGTYFPKESNQGRAGIIDLANQVTDVWTNEREKIDQATVNIINAIDRMAENEVSGDIDFEDVLDGAPAQFVHGYDSAYGGFTAAPKFPMAQNLIFLTRWWKRTGDGSTLKMMENTLEKMYRGGIYDHLGYGFHRYSVDKMWLVPHFEKMLYDQAMLTLAYSEAYGATKKPIYADVARKTITYVLRDMTAPEGGFYSAEDADSEGEEGTFYIWHKKEIIDAIGEDNAKVFNMYYGVTEAGNFESRNILNVQMSFEELAEITGSDIDKVKFLIEDSRRTLFDLREKRIHPYKDDKILTDWNGLMIAGLARSSVLLGEPEFAIYAKNAADFILEKMYTSNGRLLHSYRNGSSGVLAYLNDYAFFVWGLIELYEATYEAKYLAEAISLSNNMMELFADEKGGGLYFTGTDNEKLLTRPKDFHDGAIPSGNSVAAYNLYRLSLFTMEHDLAEKADNIMTGFSSAFNGPAQGYGMALNAIEFKTGRNKEVVIAGKIGDPDTDRMLQALKDIYVPAKVFIFHEDGEKGKGIEAVVPFVEGQKMLDGKATAYVCENFMCNQPVSDVDDFIHNLINNEEQ